MIDLETLLVMPSIPLTFAPYDVEASLEGRLYVDGTPTSPSYINQIDSATGAIQTTFGYTVSPTLLEISPDRRTLYAGVVLTSGEKLRSLMSQQSIRSLSKPPTASTTSDPPMVLLLVMTAP